MHVDERAVPLPEGWGGRLDQGLVRAEGQSRQLIQQWIKAGQVYVNGQPGRASQQVSDKDHVAVVARLGDGPSALPPLDLLYEDSAILVVNKPVGVVVHGPVTDAAKHAEGFATAVLGQRASYRLSDQLLAYCPSLDGVGESGRYGIVHRLDKDTEGVMVVAKTQASFALLKAQFHDRQISKRYYAVVKGAPLWHVHGVHAPIAKGAGGKMRVSDGGKSAETHFEVLRRFTTKTLLDVTPVTGRTHQIRVHLSFLGHTILGDPLYGRRSIRYGTGQLLQAYYLAFIHPVMGKKMFFSVPLSERLIRGAAL